MPAQMAAPYIWEVADWPNFHVDVQGLAPTLAEARKEQGKVLGLFEAIGLPEKTEIEREIWTDEAVATAAIEGERLELEAVRGSVMRRLGIDDSRGRVDRNVDGLLDVMQDAMGSFREQL